MSPVVQTIEAALADVMAEHGVIRIDCGLANYSAGKPYIVSIWFDAPEGVIGHGAAHGASLDEALAAALYEKSRKLAIQPALAA